MPRKYRKPNWKYVEVTETDIRLFQTILEQRFLRRPEVIQDIFDDKRSYAEIRIRKLKRFGFIKAIRVLAHEPECYLLGEPGVEALQEHDYVIGNLGFPIVAGKTLPEPQHHIEEASYRHDVLVTKVRFLFERLKICKDWHSEKLLKMGTKGERKVPDGFFTFGRDGIAIEVELSDKKPETYRKIFWAYYQNPKIHSVFYLCGDLSILQKIMRLAEGVALKPYYFALVDDLLELRQETTVWNQTGEDFILADMF